MTLATMNSTRFSHEAVNTHSTGKEWITKRSEGIRVGEYFIGREFLKTHASSEQRGTLALGFSDFPFLVSDFGGVSGVSQEIWLVPLVHDIHVLEHHPRSENFGPNQLSFFTNWVRLICQIKIKEQHINSIGTE